MENQSEVGSGGLRLPVGFRFKPTDEELVVHYLKRKAFNYPLPAPIIAELDALRADPRDLPGNWKEKRYFFGNNREWNGNRTSSSSSSKVVASGRGYWKPFGKETKILAPTSNLVIGFKRSLAFYESGKRLHGTKTPWLMHEFRLITSKSNPNSSQHLGNWVVRCVFHKGTNRRSRNENGVVGTRYEVRVEEDSSNTRRPQPSSPCSSGVTVASADDNNGPQEESSRPPCSGFSSD